jgi:hypothetical protein
MELQHISEGVIGQRQRGCGMVTTLRVFETIGALLMGWTTFDLEEIS